ncbi:WapI family immunity protein [Streptomyces galilaeus]
MHLSDHANSVELRPLRYQFATPRGDRYDDNWLVIGAKVTTSEGSWSFADPALTLPDATGYLSPDAWFNEPVLAFSRAERCAAGALVRVHLSLEATPPWLQGESGPDIDQYSVDIRVDTAALLQAADEWELAPASFPTR